MQSNARQPLDSLSVVSDSANKVSRLVETNQRRSITRSKAGVGVEDAP